MMKVARDERLTYKANRERGRHGWLRLTPAYSVYLVEGLVARCTRADLVLDPFCGTGTTALACSQFGIACDTVDINPFLVWLANAKCAAYPAATAADAQAALAHALAGLDDSAAGAWTPPIKDIEKWWEPATLRLLGHVFAWIDGAAGAARDLLRVIFCRVMIETAAVNFGHQSMSFKRRSRESFERAPADHIRALFQYAAADVLRSALDPAQPGLGRAYLGDARDLRAALPRQCYTAVITSPPYPNRMSYIRELRPYMYWLGYLESGRDAGELDWRAIGGTWGCATSNLMRWSPDLACRVPHADFDDLVARIAARSDVLGLYVARYFEDVVRHVRSLVTVLAPGARVQYVVGNSKFYDVVLPTEAIYASIFREHGLDDVQIAAIRKRTSKKELFEYIVSAHR